MSITINALGGICDMHRRAMPATGDKIEPVIIRVDGDGVARLIAYDLFGRQVDWAVDVTAPGNVNFDYGMGYYRIVVVRDDIELDAVELGIIPPSHEGVRPDSFFASNTGGQYKAVKLEDRALGILSGDDLKLAQAIGLKVMRCHFKSINNLEVQDYADSEAQAHGLWTLPIVGYAFPGHRSEWAELLDQFGPPDDFKEFVEKWRILITRYPHLRTWEFWNEPWIFEWTWADTPQRYRELQTMWCRLALEIDPDLRLIAGSSYMFVEDHLESHPSSWQGLLQGIAHHPYLGVLEPHNRDGANARSVDCSVLVNRRMGLKYCYLTEGGAWYGENTPENAYKLVQYFVRSALSDAYQCNSQWGIGISPGWTRPNTAYAMMTHMLEDRPAVADIWPEHELIYGGIFANPKWVDDDVLKLPRSSDFNSRWEVPIPASRESDQTKVAVIWGMTGMNNNAIDQDGTITISLADNLRAFNIVGREFQPEDGKFVLPLNQNAVYVTTERLTVIELRDRIAGARIEHITPVNMYALSLMDNADIEQEFIVRMENQLNMPICGALKLTLPGGRCTETQFEIPPAKLAEIKLTWPGCQPSERNMYPIELSASVQSIEPGGRRALREVKLNQIVQVARFVHKTIHVDGSLNDWAGVTPLTLYSMNACKVDDIEYLLNPHKKRESADAQEEYIEAKFFTAYDANYIYIAVDGWPAKPVAGTKWHEKLPFIQGEPTGLGYPTIIGDGVQFAFGFRDRVPGHGRQMNDPYAWKGHFCDTDYQYLAYNTTSGPKLVRQWGPSTSRQTAYQLDDIPHVQEVSGAKIAIGNNTYEFAIPRTELDLFDPAAGRLRFGVILNNNKLSWSETAGVFDHWSCSGSFGPSWTAKLPCQTWFAIAHA